MCDFKIWIPLWIRQWNGEMIIIAVKKLSLKKKKRGLISTYQFSDAKPNPVRDFFFLSFFFFFFFFLKFRDVFSSDVDQQSDTKCAKESNFLLHTEMKSEMKWNF